MTPGNALIKRILQSSKQSGRAALADLAYEMGRTCLSQVDADPEGYLRWFGELRAVTELRRDMDRLERRTLAALDKSAIPLGTPLGQAALSAGRACLDLGERIEGESARLRYLSALFSRSEGAVEEAADRLQQMLRGPITAAWHSTVQEGLQATLLKLGEYHEVTLIGEQLLARDPTRADAAFNLVTAFAWMEDSEGFDAAAKRFKNTLVDVVDRGYWERVTTAETPWFASRLHREPTDVMQCLVPPVPSPHSPRHLP